MRSRWVPVLGVIAALLAGCAGHEQPAVSFVGGWGNMMIVDERAGPTVKADGTAVAGWSSVTMREVEDVPALHEGGPYKLDSGDKLRVFVYAQPSLSRIYTVDTEGFISVPLIGNIKARGTSTRGLEGTIKSRLGAEFVRDPHVTVDVQQYRPFYILGEVKTAGQYPFAGGLTVAAAVAIAGGYSERANSRKVHITRRAHGLVEKLEVSADAEVRPGDTIHVPERWF